MLRTSGRTRENTNKEHEIALHNYNLKNNEVKRLKEQITEKENRHFDVVHFTKKLGTITDVKFNKELRCSLVDYAGVPESDK